MLLYKMICNWQERWRYDKELVFRLLYNPATSRGGIVEHSKMSHSIVHAFNHIIDLCQVIAPQRKLLYLHHA